MWNNANNRSFRGLDVASGEDKWKGDYVFAQLADTQFGLQWDNKKWDEEMELSKKAVEQINRLKPRFAVICGDLVHHLADIYPDTYGLPVDYNGPSDPCIRARQVADFTAVFSAVSPDIPLLLCAGNHDVGDRPTAENINAYKSDFGDDYYAFWVGGVFGVMLNSNLFSDPSKAHDLHDQQVKWFRQVMEEASAKKPKHILVFMHHPVFLRNAREDDASLGVSEFYNSSGQKITIPNSYFHLPLAPRIQILEIMQKHHARWVFSGHFHQNNISRDEEFGVTNVTTSAVGFQLGNDGHGFRLVRVKDSEIEHKYFTLDMFPESLSSWELV